MTKLSIIVLLADVLQSLGTAFIICGFLLFVIGVFLTMWKCGGFTGEESKDHTVKTILCFVFSLVLFIFGGLMPDKKTVYMIAGIEAVNEFSKTEVAKELGDSGMSIIKDITKMVHIYTQDAINESNNKTNKTKDN